ncbi:MAG TPA: allantoicase [Kiritimatiellia bacterium]|nr:allantoicase [Kiritimatiellia bacterium]
MNSPSRPVAFTGYLDLASAVLGGKALEASDEFFNAKDNLILPGHPVYHPDTYTDRGQWMDGWETRRRRTQGLDWCVIQLGLPGVIHGVDIDTSFFEGNSPAYASVEARRGDDGHWEELLPRSPLQPGGQNLFAVPDRNVWTHVRLNIFPDGGVARFRVYGQVSVNWPAMPADALIDLASVVYGGQAIACSDMFFSSMTNLILPGKAAHAGEGWETKRRRGPGYDWAIIKLGRPGVVQRVDVDTTHFKGNYPEMCSLDACLAPDEPIDALTWPEVEWINLVPKTPLGPDACHSFTGEALKSIGPVSHVKLNIFPDGGISRLRVFGVIAPA